MAVKKKKVKAKSKSRKRSAKRSVKDLSPRKSKSVKGGLLPAVKVGTIRGTSPTNPTNNPTNLNPGNLVSGDGSV
jgi:hypothetical protein